MAEKTFGFEPSELQALRLEIEGAELQRAISLTGALREIGKGKFISLDQYKQPGVVYPLFPQGTVDNYDLLVLDPRNLKEVQPLIDNSSDSLESLATVKDKTVREYRMKLPRSGQEGIDVEFYAPVLHTFDNGRSETAMSQINIIKYTKDPRTGKPKLPIVAFIDLIGQSVDPTELVALVPKTSAA